VSRRLDDTTLFRRVVTKQVKLFTNRGFRPKEHDIFTHTQEKPSLSFIYQT